MLRNIENIFPEWHSHPMDYASLHNWYDDVISAIQSIAEACPRKKFCYM